ncbi:hypothetical protein [Candidatus Poriferisocius sp.]|uniref:hypothetical protein n=1 Tax=Candidatus Poriferisocius sp. TaxID=3101276 RepID=UPI003B5258B4
MAGRPKLNILRQKVSKRGGSDWILEQVMSGRTETSMIKELECGWRTWTWLKRELNLVERIKEVRKEAATALLDTSGDVLDDLVGKEILSTQEIGLARARSDNMIKRAEKMNPEEYGRGRDTKIEITIGDVFSQFLREAQDVQEGEFEEIPEKKALTDGTG